MKKLIYLAFAVFLLIPFSIVKAEDGIQIGCSNLENGYLKDSGSICTVTYQTESTSNITISLEEGSQEKYLDITLIKSGEDDDGVTCNGGACFANFDVKLKSGVSVATDTVIALRANVNDNGTNKSADNQNAFSIKANSQGGDPTPNPNPNPNSEPEEIDPTGGNEVTPNKEEEKTTAQEEKNVNTADLNLALLAVLSVMFIGVFTFSFKKIINN